MVDGSLVRWTAAVCSDLLAPAMDDDWTVPVPDLDLSVVAVLAHAAEVCLWFAIDLSARGADLGVVEHRVSTDGPPANVLATLGAYAALVADVIDAAPPSARGFHPMGAADPSGFAAMACDELLIHSDDAARALGRDFRPPADLAEPVLRRLFPWVVPADEPVDDAWQLLRWANGRIELGHRPRLEGWAWHCAPLDEWDGTVAVRPTSS